MARASANRACVTCPTVLVVEDEKLLYWSLSRHLADWGFAPLPAPTLDAARLALRTAAPWAVLLDIHLPDGRGLDLLGEMDPGLRSRVIVMSAYGETATIVESMRLGASDFLSKPFEPEQLQEALRRLRANSPDEAVDGADPDFARMGIVSRSPSVRPVLDRLRRFAQTSRSTVLMLGETGVGKTVFARALHKLSARADHPFVEVNCAAIPHALIETELMGHERGAFTDAHGAKKGLLEEARGGTLLLDEIGDMPLEMQTKVLSFIETGTFRRLGSTREIQSDVRIVAATHRDLTTLVKQNRFREDLYYRLKVLTVDVPPLRERREDVALLCERFAAHFAQAAGTPVPRFSREATDLLSMYPWPGNIRELKHVIEAAVVLCDDEGTIRPVHLPTEIARLRDRRQSAPSLDALPAAPAWAADESPRSPVDSAEVRIPLDGTVGLESMDREILRQAILQCGGNQVRAAALLGVSRHLLRYRLKKHGML